MNPVDLGDHVPVPRHPARRVQHADAQIGLDQRGSRTLRHHGDPVTVGLERADRRGQPSAARQNLIDGEPPAESFVAARQHHGAPGPGRGDDGVRQRFDRRCQADQGDQVALPRHTDGPKSPGLPFLSVLRGEPVRIRQRLGHPRVVLPPLARVTEVDQGIEPRVQLVGVQIIGERYDAVDRPGTGVEHVGVEDDRVDTVQVAQGGTVENDRAPLGQNTSDRGGEGLGAAPGGLGRRRDQHGEPLLPAVAHEMRHDGGTQRRRAHEALEPFHGAVGQGSRTPFPRRPDMAVGPLRGGQLLLAQLPRLPHATRLHVAAGGGHRLDEQSGRAQRERMGDDVRRREQGTDGGATEAVLQFVTDTRGGLSQLQQGGNGGGEARCLNRAPGERQPGPDQARAEADAGTGVMPHHAGQPRPLRLILVGLLVVLLVELLIEVLVVLVTVFVDVELIDDRQQLVEVDRVRLTSHEDRAEGAVDLGSLDSLQREEHLFEPSCDPTGARATDRAQRYMESPGTRSHLTRARKDVPDGVGHDAPHRCGGKREHTRQRHSVLQ